MTWFVRYLMNSTVAASWSELRPDQFERIGDLLHRFQGVVLKAHITWVLLDISWRTPLKLAAFFFGIGPEARHLLTAMADPFLKLEGLTDTLLPYIGKGANRIPCHVNDLLNKVDAETWGVADTCFLKYNSTKDMTWLQRMAAVLYVKQGTSAEQRIEAVDLKPYERIPSGHLRALHTMWGGHRAVIVGESPWPFRNASEKKVVRKKTGWGDVLLSMAATKFGPWEQTRRTEARTFMRALNQAMELDHKRREEASKKRR